MVNTISSYTMDAISAFDVLQQITLTFPPGTNIQATISLSFLDTLFFDNTPVPTFAAAAFIDSWTVYQDDGTPSGPIGGAGFDQNSVTVTNCASITFDLFVERVWAIAQINVFTI